MHTQNTSGITTIINSQHTQNKSEQQVDQLIASNQCLIYYNHAPGTIKKLIRCLKISFSLFGVLKEDNETGLYYFI